MKKFLKGIGYAVFAVAILLILCAVGYKAANKLTYLEYQYINEHSYDEQTEYIEITRNDTEIIQEFISPYELVKEIHILVRAEEYDNNSNYIISVVRQKNRHTMANITVSASGIGEYLIADFGENLVLRRGEKYELHIHPENISAQTPLTFAIVSNKNTNTMTYNGESLNGALALKGYGGDRDYWWLGAYTVLIILLLLCGSYALYLRRSGDKPLNNKKFCALLIMIGTYLILAPYMASGNFGDEYDNMQGGMLIARGAVLYRDYVTQHTPVMYYLCALFAKLGASSIQQFRLCWYFLNGILWGSIYYRYADDFGKKRMFLLPIVNIVYIGMLYEQGMMVLADNMQGLCMVILLLEFLQYEKDGKIGIVRSMIVSVCTVISVGAAFVSVYAIFVLVMGLILWEYKFWKKQNAGSCGAIVQKVFLRYITIIAGTILLLGSAILYFYLNGTLARAYDMAYRFNVEVYPKYIGVIGENKLRPFMIGIKSFFEAISVPVNGLIGNIPEDSGNAVQNANTIWGYLLELGLLAAIIGILLRLIKEKKAGTMTVLFFFLCCNATREIDNFHSIPFWCVASAIVVLFSDSIVTGKIANRKMQIVMGCVIIYLVSPYIVGVNEYLFKTQEPVSELEQQVIAHTQEGEGILIDTGMCNAVYLLAKGRYPVNRTAFFLPWYFDWYEQEVIADMEKYMPRVAIYAPGRWIWNEKHFDSAFEQRIEEEYQQFSYDPDDGWMYRFWIRK